MKENKKKPQQVEETFEERLVISASSIEEPFPIPDKIVRICWNTGEEKNCASCYLNRGCKARD
jgi:hypothetical protein